MTQWIDKDASNEGFLLGSRAVWENFNATVEVAGRFRRRSLSLVVIRAIELNSPSNQSGWFSLLLSIYQSSRRGSNIAPDIDDTEITAYCACVRLPTQRLA